MAFYGLQFLSDTFDLTDPGSEEGCNITALPHVKVYNRGGSLVGSVGGVDIEKVKSYGAEAKSS